MSEEYLTVSQAAARLGVSERTIRRRCEAGTLRARLETTDSGRAWMIDAAAVGADKVRTTADTDTNSTYERLSARADAAEPTTAIVRPEEIATIKSDVEQLKAIVTTNMANQVREVLAEIPNKEDMQAAVAAATAAAIEPLVFELKTERERDTKSEVAAAINEALAPYVQQLDRVALENRELREQLTQEKARPWWKWKR